MPLVAGTEVSSTNQGRYVTFTESELTHPTHADGFVDKGDPVRVGKVVGVAMSSAKAATDKIAIDTEGIWNLSVVAGSQVALGQCLYITSAAGITDANLATSANFGYALLGNDGAGTDVLPVKVHAGITAVPTGT